MSSLLRISRYLPSRRVGVTLLLGALLIVSLVLTMLRFGDHSEPPAVPPPSPVASPLPLRQRVIDQVSADNPERLLDNLITKYDDIASAVVGSGLNVAQVGTGSYSFGQSVIPKMSRVRRILEECQNGHPVPTAKLRSLLTTSCAPGYQKLYTSLPQLQRDRAAQGLPSTAPFPEYQECGRRMVYAGTAAYLLGEFDDFESLPRFVEIWETKEQLPVSRLFLLAVMTELVRRHPTEKLTPEAVAARNTFLVEAKLIPAAETRGLPSWNAPVSETDFRTTILGEDVGADQVRKVKMRVYPPKFQDYEDAWYSTDPPKFGLKPEVFVWFGHLKTFVSRAYPPNRAGQ